ncbi:unnamed protein product [Pocillopora meandrina]|uniref:Reverse transcriptase domain-containing protein n=1 Tax=Pocillopora meandrina TaxID=46732 RepID=A0AAU9XHG8_9CNID|nr:unnamed protein product [Pocillopora meandrina]
MRPTVSFCGFPTYQLSKYLTTILQPLTDKSRRKLQSTESFIDAMKDVQIPDDYKLVQLALQCTETAIQQSTDALPLPTEDIMDLLNLCLASTYFQYNGKRYKQLHGTAMGSPVSVVVAEIVMQNIEERALADKPNRFGYATLTTHLPPYAKTKLTLFTITLTNKTPTFSLPGRSKKTASFLFSTVWWAETTTNYEKQYTENRRIPTDCLTNHPTTRFPTKLRLSRHWQDERNLFATHRTVYLTKTSTLTVFLTKTTNTGIRRNTHRATDTTETNRDSTSVTTIAAIPYIKGTSEAIARILQPYNIRVAHRPITTLRHLLTNVKDKDEPNNRQGAIYNIEHTHA